MDVIGKKVKVFWSGGWDSTSEMCRLSLLPIQVQPIYLIMNRPYHLGQAYEMKAQDKMLEMLRKRPTTKAEFLPIIRVPARDLIIPDFIKESHAKISKTFNGLSSQYYYFGAYAYRHRGMCLQVNDYYHSQGRVMQSIRKCNCQFDDNGVMYIVRNGSDETYYNLFGRCLFPLASLTANDVVKFIDDNNFWDIMKESWTCWYPINGKPCGFCHSCNVKIRQKLDFIIGGKDVVKRGMVFNYLCSKHEFDINRKHLLFCTWLRTKYNPELLNFQLKPDKFLYNEEVCKQRKKQVESYFSDEYKEKIKAFEPYFEELLNMDIEYRNIRDRIQVVGLT